jgi:hypothetical protein
MNMRTQVGIMGASPAGLLLSLLLFLRVNSTQFVSSFPS